MRDILKNATARPCRTCGAEYPHTANDIKKGDYQCKPCRSDWNRKFREKKKAAGLSGSGTPMPPSYHKAYYETYHKRPEVRKRKAELAKINRRDPAQREKHEARWKANRAINSGKLVRQPCEVCGNKKVDAHHDDYAKPLSVRFLCRAHHREFHAQAKEQSNG